MLYNVEISESCEKKLVKVNYFDIRTFLDGLDRIVENPSIGTHMDKNNTYFCYRIEKFRIFYTIQANTVRLLNFTTGRIYDDET